MEIDYEYQVAVFRALLHLQLDYLRLHHACEEHRAWQERNEEGFYRYFFCQHGGKQHVVILAPESQHPKEWCYEVEDLFSGEQFSKHYQCLYPVSAMGVADWLLAGNK